MTGLKKIILYTLLTLVTVYVIIWVGTSAYIAWKGYTFQKQTEEFQMDLSRPYREDTYGGKTPEETWGLFLDALKKGDVDLASKYFVPEKQEEWRNTISNTLRDKGGIEISKLEKIKFDSKTPETAYYYRLVNEGDTEINSSIIFILNPYTKVWKISFL